ncbi:MAG TPA: hypothetical protein ENN22_00760 [bacterium]|nr:hypothetical protein [bacterium]
MDLAIAAYQNRIASLLETANQLLVYKTTGDKFQLVRKIDIAEVSITALPQLLRQNNITELICGAVSGCVFNMLEVSGITVIPWMTGEVESVIEAYHRQSMENFIMPGCCYHRHRFRRGKRKTS